MSLNIPSYDVLGIPISAVTMRLAVDKTLSLIADRTPSIITARDVHGVMLSQRDTALFRIHQSSSLNLPDGMPLVVLGRISGFDVSRVSGPDFVRELCQAGVARGLRHFFYGGKEGVADAMSRNLANITGGCIIAGFATPPMGVDPSVIDHDLIDVIKLSNADVLWVGLSTPKQELWMSNNVGELNGMTLVGIGAAFDIYAGLVKRPPIWMQNAGLEWSYRLLNEPRRLWRRYLMLAPRFVYQVALTKLSGRRRSSAAR